MTLTRDYDHAPRFSVNYTIQPYKAAPQRRDQAASLREQCARPVSRHAGVFTAWTEAEAIRAATDAGKIPGGALNVTARKCEEAEDAPALFR